MLSSNLSRPHRFQLSSNRNALPIVITVIEENRREILPAALRRVKSSDLLSDAASKSEMAWQLQPGCSRSTNFCQALEESVWETFAVDARANRSIRWLSVPARTPFSFVSNRLPACGCAGCLNVNMIFSCYKQCRITSRRQSHGQDPSISKLCPRQRDRHLGLEGHMNCYLLLHPLPGDPSW